MRHAALALAVLVLSSCSILFDPDRAPAACPQLPAVAPFDVVAGGGTSLAWRWPPVLEDAGTFRDWQLCWGLEENTFDTCTRVTPASCDGGCTFVADSAHDAGFEYNKRVYGRIIARDRCGQDGLVATASATPLNGSFLDLVGLELATQCDAGFNVDGGVLTFEQTTPVFSNCISTLSLGDDSWRDGTVDVELRAFGSVAAAGIGFRNPSGSASSPRMAAVLFPTVAWPYSFALTRKVTGSEDLPLGSASPKVQEGVWYALRVSMDHRNVSVAMAPAGTEPKEFFRWQDLGIAEPVPGRVGVALAAINGATARAELRNFRFRTGVTIPDGGATSQAWNFAGAAALDTVRLAGGANAHIGSCPGAFTSACTGCAPSAGSQCVELNSGFLNNASAALDTPIGIDAARPWTVKLKFAAPALDGPANGEILRSSSHDWLGTALLASEGNTWMNVRGFDVDSFGAMTRTEWHKFEVTFDSVKGTYSVVIDGRAAIDGGSLPPTLDGHLGALLLGGDGVTRGIHGYWTDVEISQ